MARIYAVACQVSGYRGRPQAASDTTVLNLSPPRIALLATLTTVACLWLAACSSANLPPVNGSIAELQRIDLVDGSGAVAAPGDEVSVHYTGWIFDESAPEQRGTQFDSSLERGTPITFRLGAGRVIRGWDDGVAGMRVGGKRVLLIPAELGYGRRGAGGAIPPNASLVFEVELIDVSKQP